MYQEQISEQQAVVIISANSESGPFTSRLYVDYGELSTTVTANAKTLKGARKQAQRMLDKKFGRHYAS